jgi:hypothetical protein
MLKRTLLIISLYGSFIFLISCGGSNQQAEHNGVDSTAMREDTMSKETKELVDFKFFFTIANLPSPIEIISAIYNNEVPYNSDLLNSTDNADNYNTSSKKAVNYGVYGIDMAYTAFYGQNQNMLNYYTTAKKVSEQLGVGETFNKFTESFRANEGNKDSLVKIIDRAYVETDKYLKANNRYIVATLVISGAIIEAQYLSVELMKNREKTPENAGIYEKIFNNKLYIQNLISLMQEMKTDPDVARLFTQLESLKKSYDEIKSVEDLNKTSLTKLSAELNKIRKGIIA